MGNLFKQLIPTEAETLERFTSALDERRGICLTYVNQNCFNLYNRHTGYRDILDRVCLVYPDGKGINIGARLKGSPVEHFNATDLNAALFACFAATGKTLVVIGGRFEEGFLKQKLHGAGITLKGYRQGFMPESEFTETAKWAVRMKADILVLAMGAPRQELLAAEILAQQPDAAILCVGNFLEFFTGRVKRAPSWMRNRGIEWLHRLTKEPVRLWKRYFFGIPLFFYLLMRYSPDSSERNDQ